MNPLVSMIINTTQSLISKVGQALGGPAPWEQRFQVPEDISILNIKEPDMSTLMQSAMALTTLAAQGNQPDSIKLASEILHIENATTVKGAIESLSTAIALTITMAGMSAALMHDMADLMDEDPDEVLKILALHVATIDAEDDTPPFE